MSIFEEISEQSRRTILLQLLDGSRSVNEIVEATGLRQPNVSNHLARLRSKGIVSTTRIGRQIFYSIGKAEVEDALNAIVRTTTSPAEAPPISDLVSSYAKAAARGDERECNRIIDQALRASRDIVALYTDLLSASMSTVGTWYTESLIDEAQEHMASAITERQMARIMNYLGSPEPNGQIAIVGTAPLNHHTIGLRMLADYLTLNSWNVRYLGANVPIPSFLREVQESQPNLVLISCSHQEGVEWTLRLIREISAIRRSGSRLQIGVGGGIVSKDPTQFLESGANFVSTSLAEFAKSPLTENVRSG